MLQQGSQLGNYRILNKLGAGGMADVYKAEDLRLGRQVALKILPPVFARDPDRALRFEKEVRAAAQLHHPHIVTVFDVGHDQGVHYYSMALLTGGDLKERIRQGVSPTQSLEIMRQIASALGYAHEKGFVHRDVKPENILFDDHARPLLTDLGIAKVLGSGTKMTGTGMSIGTPHYMSPEQARGQEVDGRSDLYSLGVVLYEMLTGQMPFEAADSFAVAYAHINNPVPALPTSLTRLQPLLDRLLAKNPSERFGNAAELIGAVDTLQSGGELPRAQVERPSPQPAAARTQVMDAGQQSGKKGGVGLLWAVGGALLAVLVGGGWLLVDQQSSKPAPRGGAGVAASAPASAQPQARQAPSQPAAPATAAPAPATPVVSPEEQKRQQIEELLRLAQADIAALRLTRPPGNNALERYRQVQQLDPSSNAARQGFEQIVLRYVELSERAVTENDFGKARGYLATADEVIAGHVQVEAQRQKMAAAEHRHQHPSASISSAWQRAIEKQEKRIGNETEQAHGNKAGERQHAINSEWLNAIQSR